MTEQSRAAVQGRSTAPYICAACHHALVLHEIDEDGRRVCCVEGCGCGHERICWLPVATSDWRLRGLRDRHYAGGVGGKTVGQPGRRLAFVTFDGTAGWVSHWPKPELAKHGYGDAYVCTLFRKECDGVASEFIEAAIDLTEERWGAPPAGGWLTFVDPDEVESPNPGYCFKQAGFEVVGRTKDRDLIVLQRAAA